MDSTIENVEQVASDELDKAKARFIGGRSIDRGDPEDDERFVHSDDEGMIEEIVTTVEEDKDLECKVKKKIETKKTIAEDPETHNKITKVVKTEVTEITRTITINDENDLERAKRELGIDDVKKFLPSNCHFQSSTSWIDQPRLTRIQEKFYDPSNEIVTSKDFPSDSPVKQNSPQRENPSNDFLKSEQSLAEATTVGRGAVVETISSDEIVAAGSNSTGTTTKNVEKKKKSRLNLCSCTRSQTTDHDEEKRKQKIIEKKSKEKKKASIGNANLIQPAHDEAVRTVIDDEKSVPLTKDNEMAVEQIDETLPIYNEEQLNKILGEISQDKPLTLAEAIAYDYIDLEDPKLALQSETIRSIKNLFRPASIDEEKNFNLIRVKRSGEIFTDFNLAETNSFEKFSKTEPLIYQLQQSFEPTLDFTEKQFRSLAEIVRNHRKEYSDLQFDIGRTLIPSGDLKESSTNDFSQSDSGYSMTTTTHESLASKVKTEFETITEPIENQQQLENDEKTDEEDQRTVNHLESRSTTLDSNEIHPETVVQSTPETPKQIEVPSVTIAEPAACEVTLVTQTIEILPPPPPLVQTEVEVSPAPAVEPAACQVITVTKTLEIVPRPEDVEVEVSAPPAACEIITVIEPIRIEHLEPRPATIEPIHVESEPTPIVIPKEKHEESVVSKALENLHGASVDLPQVELVTPGPLPTLNIAKEKKEKPTKKPKEKAIKTKKSSVGLCASCFGAKAAEKKKKDATNAPIEQKKEVEEVAAATATPVEINETTPPAVVQDEIPLVSPAPIEEVSLVSPAPIEEVPRVTSALVEQVPLISATPVEEIALVTPAPVDEEPLVAPAPIEESPKVEETHKIEEIVHELPKLEDRLDATIEKLVVTEEPHYQLPSSEPVPPVVIENDYSLPDTNDYDIPRSFESPKVEEITLPKDVEVSTVEPMESKEINEISTLVASSSSPPQIESIMLNNGDDTMPNVDVKEKSSKGSYKLAKKKKEKVPKEKKPNFFTSIFRSSDRKSKTPALDLPAVERDLNVPGETPVLNIASSKSNEKIDPLHVPHVDLPQPDVQLPSFDRPEAKLIEEKPVELTVPVVELPPIADLDLPKDEKKPVEISPIELVQIPVVELPEIQYKNDENQPFVLPEIHLKTSKDPEVTVLPTVENGLALASPVNDLLDIQVNHSEFPVETDYTKTAIVDDTQHVVESSTPVKIVLPTVEESKKIEKKKTSSALCSCFGSKSTPRAPIVAPKSELPQIEMPLPSSNISSTLKTKNSLRAPTTELPAVEFNEKPSVVPQIDSIQSRSDSGLEQIVSSHMTTTSDELQQNPSISSGLGTEIKRENSFSRHDFAKKITLTDESRTKFIFRQDELKKCLENEISNSIEEFDAKKDEKILKKILSHAIDLIKDKKVSTYPELKQKLIVEHKNEAFIVDPVVRAFYCTLEKQGLDNIDKPEFPLAIRDMVRLPAQQTFDTVTQLNKTSEKSVSTPKKSSSWLCGRSKTSSNVVATPKTNVDVGLLDERRRLQLNAHRQELGTILRDRIHSTSTPIRHFNENPKDVEKILRKTLTSVTQPKILSYEQIRNDFKGEFKQTFFLVDPIVDVVRDTFDHCDITQMNEKTNLDILDANIAQTAQLYNQVAEQNHLLNGEELENLRSNRLNWLNAHLLQREPKTKSKQNKELTKILQRATNILSLNLLYTWDDINGQLRREFVKTPDLCDRSVELIKKGQKDGLFLLNQSPEAEQDVTTINIIQPNGKRRASSLITDRAKQNLKTNRNQIVKSITTLLYEHHKPLYTENQIQTYLNKTFQHLEGQKSGQFSTYNDLKLKLKKDFKSNHENLLEQIVDVIEQAHAVNQFDDIEKSEVQTLMKDRLDGKPLVIKEMFVSLPPRVGNFANSKHSNDDPSRNLSTSINGDRTLNSSTSSHRVARGLSWREANERARILFYRGKHPAIHYDEQAAGFDVRMLLETNAGGTQEIPVTDSDVHELLNSCGVQWDGVNIISLVDHSEDVVRAAEQAALKVIREKGLVDLRTPPTTRNQDEKDEPSTNA